MWILGTQGRALFHEKRSLPKTLDPKEIVARSRGEVVTVTEDITFDDSLVKSFSKPATSQETQIGLARDAIHKKLVTLADTGCWLVKGTDGVTPYAVTLRPEELALVLIYLNDIILWRVN
uniref:Uncharacterized protein n=1 Tax=Amphimedon queenslandica TaxID=400682 RepID=A0A1X7UC89_AMPQE